jgi:pyruvate kinase
MAPMPDAIPAKRLPVLPLQALQMMSAIIRRSRDILHRRRCGRTRRGLRRSEEVTEFRLAICVKQPPMLPRCINAKAIACCTEADRQAAAYFPHFQPACPNLIAARARDRGAQLKLCWGVRPYLIDRSVTTGRDAEYTDASLVKSEDVRTGVILWW